MQQLSQQCAVVEKNLFALFSGPENVCRRSRHPHPHCYIDTAMPWSHQTWYFMHTNNVHTLRVWRFMLKRICVYDAGWKSTLACVTAFSLPFIIMFPLISLYMSVSFFIVSWHTKVCAECLQSANEREISNKYIVLCGDAEWKRERDRDREALRGKTAAATTVTKKNGNYFIWIKRSQEWYTDSINPSRSLSIFEASPGWVQLNNESNRHDKRIFFASIVVVGFCGGFSVCDFQPQNYDLCISQWWAAWAGDRSLFLKLVHTYVMCVYVHSLYLSSSHSLYSSILCHQIEYHQIFVGYSIYPKYLIFCTTGTHTHTHTNACTLFSYIVQWSFSKVVQFCSGLHITADIFNEAFNIQKGCVWMGRSCHILCCSSIPSVVFSLFL